MLCPRIALQLASGAAPACARELAVSYLVDARALRNLEPVRDILTFELFADRDCSRLLHRQRISALRVDLARMRVAPVAWNQAFAGRRGARLAAVLRSAPAPKRAYLRVRGPGIRALGASCQAQDAGL